MIKIDKSGVVAGRRFVLSPNCSISWHDLVLFYVMTCMLLLAIGVFFTLQGMWLILPFSGLEMLVLGIGLYLTSRKVHRREVIILERERTRIEKGVQQVDQSWEFETPWLRLIDEYSDPYQRQRKLAIGCHGRYVEVGSFLDNSEKDELAFHLKDCIIRG